MHEIMGSWGCGSMTVRFSCGPWNGGTPRRTWHADTSRLNSCCPSSHTLGVPSAVPLEGARGGAGCLTGRESLLGYESRQLGRVRLSDEKPPGERENRP